MKRITSIIVPAFAAIAIGWFCLYAYDKEENSKSIQLKKEIAQYEEEINSIKKTLTSQNRELKLEIIRLTESTEYRYETLLIIFPDKEDQERIHNLFRKDDNSTKTDETETGSESEKE